MSRPGGEGRGGAGRGGEGRGQEGRRVSNSVQAGRGGECPVVSRPGGEGR